MWSLHIIYGLYKYVPKISVQYVQNKPRWYTKYQGVCMTSQGSNEFNRQKMTQDNQYLGRVT